MTNAVAGSALNGTLGATAAAALAGGSTSPTTSTTGDQTISQGDFLKLFIAQLQHQDPLSPLDPNDLTAQLAQFSSLEQLTSINTHLDTLTSVSKQANSASLLALLGREVDFDGSQVPVTNGKAAPVDFTLDQAQEKVDATVRASDGTVVRVVQLGALGAGPHTFQFDGKTTDGATVPDGAYGIEIDAVAPGAKVPTQVSLQGRAAVDGVDLSSDPPAVLIGSIRIPLDQVKEVHAPQS
jgi:flagellar basal-body rod modification protein FlgD